MPRLETIAKGIRLSALQRLASGELGLSVGQSEAQRCAIEVSADLRTWTLLTVTTNQGGLLRFREADAFQAPQRFYRAAGQP
jgi:hypothetical protein